ncbi:MAG: hypothetical protein HY391_04995 [Deltaproteobacteria bacterium]|nr:hypothetical protein [Deltaproteobacteria bacterium]
MTIKSGLSLYSSRLAVVSFLLLTLPVSVAAVENVPQFPQASFKSLEIVDLPSSGPRWQVDATRVRVMMERNGQVAYMDDLKMRLFGEGGRNFLISAEQGILNIDEGKMKAKGRILVTTPQNAGGEDSQKDQSRMLLKGGEVWADLNEQKVIVSGGITTEQRDPGGKLFAVTALSGEIDFKSYELRYFGKAEATLDSVQSRSREMRIQLDEKNFSIKSASALGNVELKYVEATQERKKFFARCARALFSQEPGSSLLDGKVILEGAPYLFMDGDRMEGERISMWLSNQRVLVEQAKAKVKPNFRNVSGDLNG